MFLIHRGLTDLVLGSLFSHESTDAYALLELALLEAVGALLANEGSHDGRYAEFYYWRTSSKWIFA